MEWKGHQNRYSRIIIVSYPIRDFSKIVMGEGEGECYKDSLLLDMLP